MNEDPRYDVPSPAKALTLQDVLFGGGGGGGSGSDPDRESTWLGRKFRKWARDMIEREQAGYDRPPSSYDAPMELKDYEAADLRKRKLKVEFNRINEPGIEATLAAVRTVLRYKLGPATPEQT